MKVLLLITTESDEKNARKIAKLLIKKKLAACVSFKDIYSIYYWNGLIDENKEIEISIKSKPKLLKKLKHFLLKNLSYDIPQILYKKFNSYENYLNWVEQSLSK